MTQREDSPATTDDFFASLPVLPGCLAVGAVLIWWGDRRTFVEASLGMRGLYVLIIAASLWLAVQSVRRQVAVSASAFGPYLARHSAIVWGMTVWSAVIAKLTYGSPLPTLAASSGEYRLWQFLTLGAVALPICLWGGVMFRRAVLRSLL